jgi:hypothetical protein
LEQRPVHLVRLIVSWRAAIEAAARRADIAIGGPYLRDDTVHHRRVATLRQLRRMSEVRHRWLLRRLLLFDKGPRLGVTTPLSGATAQPWRPPGT